MISREMFEKQARCDFEACKGSKSPVTTNQILGKLMKEKPFFNKILGEKVL